jgi:hypothetical protein
LGGVRKGARITRPTTQAPLYPLCGADTGTGTIRSANVKYLLLIHVNPTLLESLSEEERDAIFSAHDEFQKPIKESGELIGFAALADPTNTRTVRVRGGALAVTDGPYVEAKEFLAGYYVVDCESVERAVELAAQIPDARYTAIEVRPVMAEGGEEL